MPAGLHHTTPTTWLTCAGILVKEIIIMIRTFARRRRHSWHARQAYLLRVADAFDERPRPLVSDGDSMTLYDCRLAAAG